MYHGISYWKRWHFQLAMLHFAEVVRNHRLHLAKPLAWYPSPGGGSDVTLALVFQFFHDHASKVNFDSLGST